jgi:hypothetical protein
LHFQNGVDGFEGDLKRELFETKKMIEKERIIPGIIDFPAFNWYAQSRHHSPCGAMRRSNHVFLSMAHSF